MLVVDGGVEAELLGDPGTFFVGAGNAHNAAAVDLSDLSSDASRSSSGRGHDERFAFLGCGDFHAKKSSEPVGAKCPEENGVRNKRNLREFLEEMFRGFVDDNVVLEAREARYAVTFLVIGVARFDDFGEADGAHNFADGHDG